MGTGPHISVVVPVLNEQGNLEELLGHSITYRIAVGPRAGQKVFSLKAVPPLPEGEKADRVSQTSGFSLHAGVGAEGGERGQGASRILLR